MGTKRETAASMSRPIALLASFLTVPASLVVAMIASLVPTLIVALVEKWDGAPGDGFFPVALLLCATVGGLASSGVLISDIWKHRLAARASGHFGQLCLRASAFILAAALVPSSLFCLLDALTPTSVRHSPTLLLFTALLFGILALAGGRYSIGIFTDTLDVSTIEGE